jgi:hypothetical protein
MQEALSKITDSCHGTGSVSECPVLEVLELTEIEEGNNYGTVKLL